MTDNAQKKPEKKPDKKPPAVSDAENDKKFERAFIRLKKLLDLIKGKEDVRNRLSSILDPQNPKTSSKLSAGQVNFVIDAYWFAERYPDLYGPLKDLASELLPTNLSLDGYGLDTAIRLTSAIEQSQLLKTMYGSVEEKKSRLPSFKKAETKQ